MICLEPTTTESQAPDSPLLFVVWIDCNCGYAKPDWEMDYPPGREQEPLPQALMHAAQARQKGFPAVLMLPGRTPRSDGLFSLFDINNPFI